MSESCVNRKSIITTIHYRFCWPHAIRASNTARWVRRGALPAWLGLQGTPPLRYPLKASPLPHRSSGLNGAISFLTMSRIRLITEVPWDSLAKFAGSNT